MDDRVNPLTVRKVKNAVVYPTIRVASHPGKLLMGVYDGDDAYVEGTVLDRQSGEQGFPVPRDLFPNVTHGDTPEAIFAGPLYFHFGHFLTESLARVWYAHSHPDATLVWAGQHNWQDATLRSWQVEVLDILGITNPTRIVADPTRFDLVYVPDIGYRYPDRFHPHHAEFLGRCRGPAQEPGRRLWLSRSKVDNDARDLNAEPTERRLVEAGWTIAHPETMSIREQLEELSRAETVAGEEGSAFHSIVLLDDVSAKTFHILRRHGREHPNMHTIGDARGVHQTFHTLERERVLRANGRFVTKVNPNASEILDLLNVPVAPTSVAPRPTANDMVARLILRNTQPARVLDLGAKGPHVIVASAAPVRVAVSPVFAFDPRAFADTGVEFYEVDPSTYAEAFHDERRPFDIIRITGADLGEMMSAFAVSTALAHKSTTWILGTGDLGARAAVAIRAGHPGYTARRAVIRFRTVYVARRKRTGPTNDSDVAGLSAIGLRRRTWLMPLGAVPYGTGVSERVKRVVPGRVKRIVRRAQQRLVH